MHIAAVHFEGGVKTHHIKNVQVIDDGLAFDQHIKNPRAHGLQTDFSHAEGNVVGTAGDGQFVGECAPTCTRIKSGLIRGGYRRSVTNQVAGFSEGDIRLEFQSLTAYKGHSASAQGYNHLIVWIVVRQWLSGTNAEIVKIHAT